MLLLAWLLGFHYPFLCRNILLELLSRASSSCRVVYAWLICGWLISPSASCSVWTCRVDEVTYSEMIDIFIRGGECFKMLKRRHLSGEWHLAAQRSQTNPSWVSRRHELSPSAAAVRLKDGAGGLQKVVEDDWEEQGVFWGVGQVICLKCDLKTYKRGFSQVFSVFVLTYRVNVNDFASTHCGFYWKKSQTLFTQQP